MDAHLIASEHAPAIGFRKYIISATTPFQPDDLAELRVDAPRGGATACPGLRGRIRASGLEDVPEHREGLRQRTGARDELGWRPRYDFNFVIDRLRAGDDPRSPLAREIGSKGYHAEAFPEGPYPVETTSPPSGTGIASNRVGELPPGRQADLR